MSFCRQRQRAQSQAGGYGNHRADSARQRKPVPEFACRGDASIHARSDPRLSDRVHRRESGRIPNRRAALARKARQRFHLCGQPHRRTRTGAGGNGFAHGLRNRQRRQNCASPRCQRLYRRPAHGLRGHAGAAERGASENRCFRRCTRRRRLLRAPLRGRYGSLAGGRRAV